jgi:hypothetical protein
MPKRGNRRTSDSHGTMQYDSHNPRLATLRQIRWGNKIREELIDADSKRAKAKVSLPKFSWDKDDGKEV